jgi:LCP family protein required for cell wall assembly
MKFQSYSTVRYYRMQSRRMNRNTKPVSPVMWGLLGAFIISTIITAYLTFAAVRQFFTAQPETSGVESFTFSSTPAPERRNPLVLNQPLQPATGPTPQPWDGADRVNVLLMGLDYRDWESGNGASRTDTMILFTVDPVTRSAGMLSIPRDLWVNIPGFDYGKINTAYYLGEIYGLPGGGPGLAVQTVEQFLGIPINYYAQVDFQAFENFINEIGGVEVDVPEEITVDPIGPGNTVTLEPGSQTLDGPTALAYARNRDTFGGDFDRSKRQQQVILGIRDRLLDLNQLKGLITKAPVLYNQLSAGVTSNMTLEEMIKLAWLAQQIPAESIKRGGIGPDEVTISMSPEGLDILLPDTDAVRALRDDIFTATGPASPVATTVQNLDELVLAENAKVSVLNATSVAGLAAQTSDYLKSNDIQVVETGNAQDLTDLTTILDYSGKPYTVEHLVDLLHVAPNRIYSRFDPNSEVDIAILLGSDWAADNSMP